MIINNKSYLFKCSQNIAKKNFNDADSFDDCQPSLSKLEIVKGVRSLKQASEQPPYMWLPGLGDKEGERTNEQEESYQKR